MADLSEVRMNIAAIRRLDPYVEKIIDSAKHVALYTFNDEENEWEKTEIEGALFVYSRSGEPFNSFVIINRLSTVNLIEPVTKGIELQLKTPFLLYRNSRFHIHGIWFYDKEDCDRVTSVLETLIKQAVNELKLVKKQPKSGKDILSLLSKAQDDYNANKAEPSSLSSVDSSILDMPKGVVDFFAKASGGKSSHFPINNLPQAGVFPTHAAPRTIPISLESLQSSAETKQLTPILQRIMSNPVHSVEHIEKQQRSVTPVSEDNCKLSRHNKNGYKLSNGTDDSLPLQLSNHAAGIKKTSPIEIPSGSSHFPLLDHMGFIRISSPPPAAVKESVTTNSVLKYADSSVSKPDTEEETVFQRPVSAPLNKDTQASQKPALIPPTMFTTTFKSAQADATTLLNSSISTTEPNFVAVESSEPIYLNKTQFLQGFNHLLKTDQDFIKKIYRAYLESLNGVVPS